MTRLYLDIETYRKDEDSKFTNEKIIAIGVLEDWTPYSEESLTIASESEVCFKMFSEWDFGGEKNVIEKFYEYFDDIISMSEFLVVIGFGILRFDIPLLIQKGIEYDVIPLSHLNKLWYNKTFTIDLFQVALPLNNMRFRGNTLENLINKAKQYGINILSTYGRGEDVPKWYEERKYDEILKHLKTDLEATRYIDLTNAITRILILK